MRIAIVNDIKITTEFLRLIVEAGGHQIAWIAANGAEAVEKSARDTPDLILMDLIMPLMDGVKATELIMKNNPCAILIVTASVGTNASKVFEAMGYGALDVVRTPSMMQNPGQNGADLIKKIAIIAKYLGIKTFDQKAENPHKASSLPRLPPLIVIGASTGGPMALAKMLNKLPRNAPFAIVVIQHVDEQFANSLSQWLAKQIPLQVKLAQDGDMPMPGHVLIAGKDRHLVLTPNLTLHYQEDPLDIPYRPSVNVFFKSVAEQWPEESIAVLLTGMGSDGAQGLKMLHDRGWYTLAQSQSSCVVFGMPKSAIELGAVSEVLPIEDIAKKIISQMKGLRGRD